MDLLKPVLKDLVSTQLLRKCLQGYTSIAYESLNLIWRYCPKTKSRGPLVVELGTTLAASVCNDGADATITTMEKAGLSAGKFCCNVCGQKDISCVLDAERRRSEGLWQLEEQGEG